MITKKKTQDVLKSSLNAHIPMVNLSVAELICVLMPNNDKLISRTDFIISLYRGTEKLSTVQIRLGLIDFYGLLTLCRLFKAQTHSGL